MDFLSKQLVAWLSIRLLPNACLCNLAQNEHIFRRSAFICCANCFKTILNSNRQYWIRVIEPGLPSALRVSPSQRWFCAALCPRQAASGCCAQPLPPFGLFSLFSVLYCLLSRLLWPWLLCCVEKLPHGKLSSPPPPLLSMVILSSTPDFFIGRLQIGLFGSVFPPDFCTSLRHGDTVVYPTSLDSSPSKNADPTPAAVEKRVL